MTDIPSQQELLEQAYQQGRLEERTAPKTATKAQVGAIFAGVTTAAEIVLAALPVDGLAHLILGAIVGGVGVTLTGLGVWSATNVERNDAP